MNVMMAARWPSFKTFQLELVMLVLGTVISAWTLTNALFVQRVFFSGRQTTFVIASASLDTMEIELQECVKIAPKTVSFARIVQNAIFVWKGFTYSWKISVMKNV